METKVGGIPNANVEGWIAEGRAGMLLEMIEERYGPVPPELREKLMAVASIEAVRGYQTTFIHSATLEEFRQKSGL